MPYLGSRITNSVLRYKWYYVLNLSLQVRELRPGEVEAVKTLPKELGLAKSGIPEGGEGIWTKRMIPKGIMFGPYKGIKTATPLCPDYSRVVMNRKIFYWSHKIRLKIYNYK